jgi:hypothetical protein
VVDFYWERAGFRVILQFRPDHVFLAHQNHLYTEAFCRSNRAFDFRFRGMVPAHGINSDGYHGIRAAVCATAGILFLLDFDDFAAFILAAMGTRPVRQLLLVAVGTLR